MSKLDGASYNRFLVSVGYLLLLAGFLVPAFVWRDSQWLLVSQQALEGLSPLAKNVVLDRQRLLADMLPVAIGVGGLLAVVGVFVLVAGGRRLKERQAKDDALASIDIDLKGLDLRRASEVERMAGDLEEALEQTNSQGDTSEPGGATSSSFMVDSAQIGKAARTIEEARSVEEEVLQHLKMLLSDGGLVPNLAVADGAQRFDAVWISERADTGFIVGVEVKLAGGNAERAAMRGKEQLQRSLDALGSMPNRRLAGMVIIVSDTHHLTPEIHGPDGDERHSIWTMFVNRERIGDWIPPLDEVRETARPVPWPR